MTLGLLIGGGLSELFGWRTPFFVMAGFGVVIAVIVTTLREPARGALDVVAIGADDDLEAAEVAGELPRTDWRTYAADLRDPLRIPTACYLFIGVPITILGFNGVAFWLPTFWERAYDLGEGAAGAIAGALGLTAALGGAIVGGTMGDRAHARSATARITITGFSLGVGGVVMMFGMAVPALVLQVLVLIVGAFILTMSTPNTAAVIAEVIPAARRGPGSPFSTS